jgi:hypothetical protein
MSSLAADDRWDSVYDDWAHDAAMAMFAKDEEGLRVAVEQLRESIERAEGSTALPLRQRRELATVRELLGYADEMLDAGWHVVEMDEAGLPERDSHDTVEQLLEDTSWLARRALRTAASAGERMRWALILRRTQSLRRHRRLASIAQPFAAPAHTAAHNLTHSLTSATNAPPRRTATTCLSTQISAGRAAAA